MEWWEKRQQLYDHLKEILSKDEISDEDRADADRTQKRIEDGDADFKRLQSLKVKREGVNKPEPIEDEDIQPVIDPKPERRDIVPATPKRWTAGSLKGFESADEAYATGQFLAATCFRRSSSLKWCRDNGIEVRSMNEGTDTAGGYVVPAPMEATIIRLVEEYGVFRNNARTIVMASDTHTVPVRAGGLTVYYPGELGTITTSDASFGNAKLVAHKMATLTQVSSELNEDALISVADLVTTEIAQAFSNAEDEAGFNGDGTSTYGHMQGLKSKVGSAGTATAITGNTAFGTLDLADFEEAISLLPRYPGIQPRWYISYPGYALSMMRLLDAAGGNTVATLEAGAQQAQFLGYPVVFTRVLPTTSAAQVSTIVAYFGDLGMGAFFGVRRGVSIATSNDVYFTTDGIGIRATQRVDVNCHSVGDATNPGAVIALKTPAS